MFAGASSGYLYRQTAGTTLTIGSGITVSGSGTGNVNLGYYTDDAINFQGTLNANVAGKTWYLGSVANTGNINVSAGTVHMDTVSGTGTWTNTGTVGKGIAVSGGILNLGDAFNASVLGNIVQTAGTVNLTGTMTLDQASTNLSTVGMTGLVVNGGTIVGGGSTLTSNGTLALSATSGATLNNVVLATDLSVTGLAYFSNGLTLAQNATVTLATGGDLHYSGTQTLGDWQPGIRRHGDHLPLSPDGGHSADHWQRHHGERQRYGQRLPWLLHRRRDQFPGHAECQCGRQDLAPRQRRQHRQHQHQRRHRLHGYRLGYRHLDEHRHGRQGVSLFPAASSIWAMPSTPACSATSCRRPAREPHRHDDAGPGQHQPVDSGDDRAGGQRRHHCRRRQYANLKWHARTLGDEWRDIEQCRARHGSERYRSCLFQQRPDAGAERHDDEQRYGHARYQRRPPLQRHADAGGTGSLVFASNSTNYLYRQTAGTTLTIGSGITVSGSGTGNVNLGYYTDDAINFQGTLNANVAGKTWYLGSVANTGNINVSAGTVHMDTVSVPAPGRTPARSARGIAVSGGILNLGDAFNASVLGNIVQTGGTVNLTGVMTLNQASTNLSTVGLTSLVVTGGGAEIIGGGNTLTSNGTLALSATGGATLNNVTLATDLTVSGFAIPQNGLTLAQNATTANNATLTLGTSADLRYNGTQTLGGTGNLVFGGTGTTYLYRQTAGTTLTIGSGITVSGSGTGNASLGYYADETIDFRGTLNASVGGKTWYLGGINNTGNINVGAGTVNMDSISGTSTWMNTGAVGKGFTVSGGILNLGDSFTTTGIGRITRTGGTVNITGTLDNSGQTLDIGAAGPFGAGGLSSLTGIIANGTIVSNDGTLLNSSSGDLNGITIGSNLGFSAGTTHLTNGLLLASGVTVNKGSSTWYFGSGGTQNLTTVAGTATINSTGAEFTPVGALPGRRCRSAAALPCRGSGTLGDSSAATIVNNGTLIANTAAQTLTINPTNLTNNGTLRVTAGTLNLAATNWTNSATGSIEAQGGTLTLGGINLGNSGALSLSAGATFNFGGTVTLGSLGSFSRAAGSTVNLTGTLNLGGGTLDIGAAGAFARRPQFAHGDRRQRHDCQQRWHLAQQLRRPAERDHPRQQPQFRQWLDLHLQPPVAGERHYRQQGQQHLVFDSTGRKTWRRCPAVPRSTLRVADSMPAGGGGTDAADWQRHHLSGLWRGQRQQRRNHRQQRHLHRQYDRSDADDQPDEPDQQRYAPCYRWYALNVNPTNWTNTGTISIQGGSFSLSGSNLVNTGTTTVDPVPR